MNRITQMFHDFQRQGRKALVAFLTAGFPSLRMTERCVLAAVGAGVDLVELGVPFSDPIADGPTIQYASEQALRHGISLRAILRCVARLRPRLPVPIVLMTYLNPVWRYGLRPFVKDAARAGVDGLIVPDMIPEESSVLTRLMRARGLAPIFLVAPTTPLARQRSIARASEGFLYVVSMTGVTGSRQALPPGIPRFLQQLHRLTAKPLALGFGISRPDHVRLVKQDVEGVIVGSALIDILRRSVSPERLVRFLRSLRKALD